MKALASQILVLLLLTAPQPVSAQARQTEGLPAEFWTRFEKGFDRFLSSVLDDFTQEKGAKSRELSAGNPGRIIRADTVISAGDTLRGNILVENATLTLAGVVDGDLTARGGSIQLRSGSRITGNVFATNADITRDEHSEIGGAFDQRRAQWPDQIEDQWDHPSSLRRPLPWNSESWTHSPFFVRYNRVEGLFLGLGSAKKYYWYGEHDFSAFGSAGYGFLSHRWRGNLGITRQFAIPASEGRWLIEGGVEGYSLTDTKDPWIIGEAENSAAAFFIREDYRDYFEREGFTSHIGAFYRTPELRGEARVAFLADRYRSLDDRASWALFGGDKTFRLNPQIEDGRMRSVMAVVGVSTVDPVQRIPEGWTTFAMAEFADPTALGGDFDFQKYVLEMRRYQPIGRYDRVNLRLRAGSSHGMLPRQKAYELGGPGTLPAFGFATLPGDSTGANRMLLFNAEYIVNGDVLHDLLFWPSWLMRHVNLLFLTDAGFVRSVDPSVAPLSGFGGIGWNDFRSDIGLGVSNVSGTVRAAVVWRTDRNESARFIFRFSRPF